MQLECICFLSSEARGAQFLQLPPLGSMSKAPEVFDLECPSDEDEAFDWFQGVYETWETVRALRQRALQGRCILLGVRRKSDQAEVIVGSLKVAGLNVKLVRMVSERMACHGIVRNPPLARLYGQFLSFHQQNGNLTGDTLHHVSHADAWGLKRILSFMRRKWKRGEQPRAT